MDGRGIFGLGSVVLVFWFMLDEIWVGIGLVVGSSGIGENWYEGM